VYFCADYFASKKRSLTRDALIVVPRKDIVSDSTSTDSGNSLQPCVQ